MASRQGMIRTTIALGIALALGAPLTASAQGGGERATSYACARRRRWCGRSAGGGGRRPRSRRSTTYTPAAGARDLRSVLHNWGWHLGMLRSDQERD